MAEIQDYREELVVSLSSARELAAKSIQRAQRKYKASYDQRAMQKHYQVGDWILIRFPQDESGKDCKLSRPWHGLYRVVECHGPDISAVKVYLPQDGRVQVHQMRVTPCPSEFPAGYYWYGDKRSGPGRPPKWVGQLLSGEPPGTGQAPESDSAGGLDITPDTDPTGGEDGTYLSEGDCDGETEPQPDEDVRECVEPPPRSARGFNRRYGLRTQVTPPERL